MSKTLFVVAARSGGHLLPALTLAQQWYESNERGTVFLFTSTAQLDQRIAQKYPFVRVVTCTGDRLPGKKWYLWPLFILQITSTLAKAVWFSLWYRPEKVIATGGLLSIPVGCAVRLLQLPLEVYELNVEPGRATTFLAPLATQLKVTFTQTESFFKQWQSKCSVEHYPLRKVFLQVPVTYEDAFSYMWEKGVAFSKARKTLFVLGGSQGSLQLNKLVEAFLKNHSSVREHIQVIHQTPVTYKNSLAQFYASLGIQAYIFDYDDHIEHAYALADVIVCRAGAGTLHEVLQCYKKAVVVPLRSTTTKHQVANALCMQERAPELFTVCDSDGEFVQPEQKFGQILEKQL